MRTATAQQVSAQLLYHVFVAVHLVVVPALLLVQQSGIQSLSICIMQLLGIRNVRFTCSAVAFRRGFVNATAACKFMFTHSLTYWPPAQAADIKDMSVVDSARGKKYSSVNNAGGQQWSRRRHFCTGDATVMMMYRRSSFTHSRHDSRLTRPPGPATCHAVRYSHSSAPAGVSVSITTAAAAPSYSLQVDRRTLAHWVAQFPDKCGKYASHRRGNRPGPLHEKNIHE